jgi:GTP:adenosylcobinamide-phosphate guanylyltransferase
MDIDAVVLAARANTGKLASESDELLEANIDISGRPMVSYVLSALEGVPEISRILLVGPNDGLSGYASGKVTIVEPGKDLIDNAKIGIAHAQTEFVLVSCSDIPLLTGDILKDFIAGAVAENADFVYPVSTKEDCIKKYPGVQRTYARLKGVNLTGGNLFFVRRSTVGKTWPVVEKMIEYRKSPLKMASFLGIGLLLRIFLGFAGVLEIEEYVSDMLGIKCKALLAVPEIGFDVDKPQDLELVKAVLGK